MPPPGPPLAAVSGFDDAKLEALVETMVLAAHADGEFSDDERKHFLDSVQSLTDGRLSKERLDDLVTRAAKELESSGRDARLATIKARLPEDGQRRVALSLAIRVTAADGIIRTSERELLLELAEGLDIDRDVAADLVKEMTR